MLMQLVGQNQRFERVEVSREEALSMFQENKFKVCCSGLVVATTYAAFLGQTPCRCRGIAICMRQTERPIGASHMTSPRLPGNL